MINERLIRATEAEVNRLSAACGQAASERKASPLKHEHWLRACHRFHSYSSPVWELWTPEAQRDIVAGSGDWRKAALLYLDLSPRFFRSGYLRDMVCHRLKQASLQADECHRVQRILLASIVRRPSTGYFVYDCRLAIKIADESFAVELRRLAESEDPWTRGRAVRMLAWILRHQGSSQTLT